MRDRKRRSFSSYRAVPSQRRRRSGLPQVAQVEESAAAARAGRWGSASRSGSQAGQTRRASDRPITMASEAVSSITTTGSPSRRPISLMVRSWMIVPGRFSSTVTPFRPRPPNALSSSTRTVRSGSQPSGSSVANRAGSTSMRCRTSWANSRNRNTCAPCTAASLAARVVLPTAGGPVSATNPGTAKHLRQA